ncbi:MAG: Rpn family recombination-promoting nuclease/putative transposase [Clostridia bacterium]|nr:Rpn family recombination-promoting nuclease/putative transposase [Clostridia bacterium]
MLKQDLLKLTNDYIFKRTFGYKGEEPVTRIFLRDLLKMEIKEIELDQNTITEKDIITDKVGIMDIKAELNNNMECDIEMQVVNQKNIEKRILFYWSKIYSKTIKEGNGYGALKKSVVVLIADFEFDRFQSIEKYLTKWKIREEDYPKIVLTDVLEIYIIELPKYSKYAVNEKIESLNLWVKFIKNPEVIIMVNKNDSKEVKETKQAINKAKERLQELSNDEHERYLAELREKYTRDQYEIQAYGYDKGIEEGKREGIKRGIEEGKKEKAIEIAKKLLLQNIDMAVIIKCTGLTKEEINKIV